MKAAAAILAVAAALAGAAAGASGAPSAAAVCSGKVALALPSVVDGPRGDLYDLAVVSGRDVWAGGWDGARVGTDAIRARPLLAHWNGRRWRRTAVPVKWGIAAPVVARSATDVWAVVDNRGGTILLRWNGRRWSRSPLPRGAGAYETSLLLGARGRLWLTGRRVYVRVGPRWRPQPQFGDHPNNLRIVVSRWTDALWRVMPSPQPGQSPPRVERWSGRSWVRTPLAVSRFTELGNPVALSATDAWIGGSDGDHALLFRWNGRTWRRVAGPPARAIDVRVFAPSRGDLWLGGSTSDRAATVFPPYLRHRLGTRWTSIAAPSDEDGDDVTLYGVGRGVWARPDLREGIFRLAC